METVRSGANQTVMIGVVTYDDAIWEFCDSGLKSRSCQLELCLGNKSKNYSGHMVSKLKP